MKVWELFAELSKIPAGADVYVNWNTDEDWSAIDSIEKVDDVVLLNLAGAQERMQAAPAKPAKNKGA